MQTETTNGASNLSGDPRNVGPLARYGVGHQGVAAQVANHKNGDTGLARALTQEGLIHSDRWNITASVWNAVPRCHAACGNARFAPRAVREVNELMADLLGFGRDRDRAAWHTGGRASLGRMAGHRVV